MADQSLREGAREVTQQMRPSELNPKLEEAMQNQPLLPHLVDLRVVLTAAAIGGVIALLLLVLMSPMMAGVGLLIAFFAAWFGLAVRDYSRAESRRPRDDEEEAEEDS
jgi:hypothetical protein